MLMTIPGISHVTALGMLPEMADIGRFPTDEKLAAYGGRAVPPQQRQDGARRRHNKAGSAWLRRALVNAAPRPNAGYGLTPPVCVRRAVEGGQATTLSYIYLSFNVH